MEKDQQDWGNLVPESDKYGEVVTEQFPPRGVTLPETQIKIIQVDTDTGSTTKKPVKSVKNNRLDSKGKYVPFNQSYRSSHQNSFMKVSDIHENTERFSIRVKVIKQNFYYNSQDVECTQVTLADSSGSAWGYFIGENCRYFIQGSILCIVNGTVRIFNNRISLQLNRNSKNSYIYQCELKNIETNTKYNISHRIIEDKYQYRQAPPVTPSWKTRGGYRNNYHRPYYQYAQPERRNSYSRSSSRNSSRSSFHKNIRSDYQRINQGNKQYNSRNQSKRKNSFRQESNDKFQNQKRCNHACDCSRRYDKSRRKQYIEKSIQKRSQRNDRNHIQKPRAYHSYLLNKSSLTSFNKTMNDDAKNDSIQVRVSNASTIVSSLASPHTMILQPVTDQSVCVTQERLPVAKISVPEKKEGQKDSSEVQIVNESIE